MLEFSWFICGILYSLLYCYLFSNLFCQQKFKINLKIIIFSIIFSFLYCIIMKINSGIIKPYLTHLFITIILFLIYKKSFVKIMISVLFTFLLLCVSELLYDVVCIGLFNIDLVSVLENPFIYIFSNVIILFLTITMTRIYFIRKVIYNIVKWSATNEIISMVFFIIIAMSIATFLMYNNFFQYLPPKIMWFTNLFCLSVMIFVIGFFKEKSNNNRIITEYDQLLDYVKTYEKVIETKSKNQHEYKNQLILIKGMIKNKKVISYIDELLKTETDDSNVELLRKLQYLPQGGLKGLIYYKVEQMINIGVDVYVDISEEISKKKIINKLNKNLQDISKIIGVYIDNAIEAVKELKDKYIVIEIYLEDDEIIFSLSNNYNGNINFDKVDKEGYTTKGSGKGYGLPLVKDILNHNDNLSQERSLNGIYYVQKLKIKK